MKFKQLQKYFFLLRKINKFDFFFFKTKDDEINKYQKRLNELQINIDQLESQVC
jgi:hypothetical protein